MGTCFGVEVNTARYLAHLLAKTSSEAVNDFTRKELWARLDRIEHIGRRIKTESLDSPHPTMYDFGVALGEYTLDGRDALRSAIEDRSRLSQLVIPAHVLTAQAYHLEDQINKFSY